MVGIAEERNAIESNFPRVELQQPWDSVKVNSTAIQGKTLLLPYSGSFEHFAILWGMGNFLTIEEISDSSIKFRGLFNNQ